MRKPFFCLLMAAVVAATLLLAACPVGKTVAEINKDPMRYSDKEVAVRGEVVSSFGAMGAGIFQIDDGTGRLWVLSSKYGVPARGTRIGVAGTIVPTLTFMGKSYATVMKETQRRKM